MLQLRPLGPLRGLLGEVPGQEPEPVVHPVLEAGEHGLRGAGGDLTTAHSLVRGVVDLHGVGLQRRAAVRGRGPVDGQLTVTALDRGLCRLVRAHIRSRHRRGGRGIGLADLVDGDHLEGVLRAVGQPVDGARRRGARLADRGTGHARDLVARDRGAVVRARGEVQLDESVPHLADARGRGGIRQAAHGHPDLAADLTIGVAGLVHDRVPGVEDAGVLRIGRDHDLIAVQGDLSVTGDQAHVEDLPLPAREGVRIVLEHGDRVGATRIDRRLVQRGGDRGSLRAADGDLDTRRHRRVRPVGDADRHLQDRVLG